MIGAHMGTVESCGFDIAGICSVCGTADNVVLDHAGWGWICNACFKLPHEQIAYQQLDRETKRLENIKKVLSE